MNNMKKSNKIVNKIEKKNDKYDCCIKYIKSNHKNKKITYESLIYFLELLKKADLYYDKENKIYFDVEKLLNYVIPSINKN